METALAVVFIGIVAVTLYALGDNGRLGFAFINNEIESAPGIYIFEDCYNGIDDDGDGLKDAQDTFDCFNSTSNMTIP